MTGVAVAVGVGVKVGVGVRVGVFVGVLVGFGVAVRVGVGGTEVNVGAAVIVGAAWAISRELCAMAFRELPLFPQLTSAIASNSSRLARKGIDVLLIFCLLIDVRVFSLTCGLTRRFLVIGWRLVKSCNLTVEKEHE